jgi:hypothetical protein
MNYLAPKNISAFTFPSSTMLPSYRVHLIGRHLATIMMFVLHRVQIMIHGISDKVKNFISYAFCVEPNSLYTGTWSRNSVFGIATHYGLDDPGIEFRLGARFSASVKTSSEAYPASYRMRTRSFPGVKRSGRGVNHTPHLAPKINKV